MDDWIRIQRLGVKGRYPKSTSIKEVIWNFLAEGWLKCNIDRSALKAPQDQWAVVVFFVLLTKCCFSFGIGIHYAFEAEMMAFIFAIEKVYEFN